MESVLRAAFIYVILLVLFSVSGRRTLTQMTTLDFILLLIIGEATQNALLGNDFSLTNATVVITTLIAIDILLNIIKEKSPPLEKVLDGTPTILISDGELLKDRLVQTQVDEIDILERARELQGLERLDQIKYAILEKSGSISIIPKSG